MNLVLKERFLGRAKINTIVFVEMCVFRSENDVDGLLGDLLQWNVESPLIVIGSFDMEELPLPIVIGTAGSLFFQVHERIRAEGRRERPRRPGGAAKNSGDRTDGYDGP